MLKMRIRDKKAAKYHATTVHLLSRDDVKTYSSTTQQLK